MNKKLFSFDAFEKTMINESESIDTESIVEMTDLEHDAVISEDQEDGKYYDFLKRATVIKHQLDELLEMDKEKIESLLSDNKWACEHLESAQEDVHSVWEWLITVMSTPEIEQTVTSPETEDDETIDVENIDVEVEDDKPNSDEDTDDEEDDEENADEEGDDDDDDEETEEGDTQIIA